MNPYQNDFSSWEDVQSQFGMSEPEPKNLLIADYTYEFYEGDSNVLWKNEDGTFGYVSGGHCSCHGLEGQWEPESYTRDQLLGQIEKANYGFFKDQRMYLLSVIGETK